MSIKHNQNFHYIFTINTTQDLYLVLGPITHDLYQLAEVESEDTDGHQQRVALGRRPHLIEASAATALGVLAVLLVAHRQHLRGVVEVLSLHRRELAARLHVSQLASTPR